MKKGNPGNRPLFLDPDRYRRRRLMDAARMLPVLGAFLFLLPVLWQPGPSGHSTATEGVYLFAVWAMLILLARLFAPGLASGEVPAGGAAPVDLPTGLSADPALPPLSPRRVDGMDGDGKDGDSKDAG